MTWHVFWTSRGETMLQQALDASAQPDKTAIASEMMERLLEIDPFAVGESRADDDRILFQGDYAAIYRVHTDDQVVGIHTFWRWAK